jgi:hypothetical protein
VKFQKLFSAFLVSGIFLTRALAAPTAEEIIQKVKERSANAAREKNSFAYQRVSRTDYLDENEQVKRNSLRIYEVAPLNGEPVSKLVQVNGRPPKKEPPRSAAREAGDKSRNLALGEDLLSRYEYELRGEEQIAGRNAWILAFKPTRNAREDGFVDKLVNAMQGTMWVDQQEYEISKVDVHLSRKLSFFGLLGGIEKLDLQMVQKRLNSQAWLTEALTLDFTGRKLFTPIRFRCVENCSDFKKVVPSGQPVASLP